MKEKRRTLSSVKPDDLTPQTPGKLVRIADGWAFVPGHLPPMGLSLSIMAAAEEARGAVGELVGQARLVQNPELIIAPFRREEAVLSSRIEGTRTEIQDLLLAEATPRDEIVEDSDTFEVLNYLDALVMGEGWIAEGRPLNYTLISGLHAELLHGVRGRDKHPGALRTTQVYIGDRGRGIDTASYVPPPPEQVAPLMDDLLQFFQGPPSFSPLVDCAIAHYQFEAIHPYEDGNGRLGRLLVPLYLRSRGVLDRPILYVGPYLEAHRTEYFDRLLRVTTHGDWDGWVRFFLQGVRDQAHESVRRAQRIRDLYDGYHARIMQATSAVSTRRALDVIFDRVYVWAKVLSDELSITPPTARHAIDTLVALDILKPSRRGSRGRQLWVAQELLDTVYAA